MILPIIEVLAALIGNMVNVIVTTSKNEYQQSVNDFECCIMYNPGAVEWLLPIIVVLPAFIGHLVNVNVPTPENERQKSIKDFQSCK